MNEIPKDVRSMARKICLDQGVDNPFGFEETLAAKAILAERNRCLDILGSLETYAYIHEAEKAIRG